MTLCDPTARDDVEKVATPEESVPLPSVVVPSRKVTVPLGVPEPLGVTVAVKVTLVPVTTVVAEANRVVVVAAGVVTTGTELLIRITFPARISGLPS